MRSRTRVMRSLFACAWINHASTHSAHKIHANIHIHTCRDMHKYRMHTLYEYYVRLQHNALTVRMIHTYFMPKTNRSHDRAPLRCGRACMQACKHASVGAIVRSLVCMCLWECVRICASIHTCTCTHTYMHTSVSTYTHLHNGRARAHAPM